MKTKITSLICMVVITNSFNALSQDLVVTKEKDSINARIIKVKNKMLHFYFVKDGEVRKTLLPLSEVAYYDKHYFFTTEVPKEYSGASNKSRQGSKFRIALSGGPGFITAPNAENIPPVLESFANALKKGIHWDVSGHYFFNDFVGLGIKYNGFYSSETDNNIHFIFEDGSTHHGLTADVFIHFIGPSFASRLLSHSGKNSWNSEIALGYMHISELTMLGTRSIDVKGEDLGLHFEVGYDVGLSEQWSLGFSASYTDAVFHEVTVTDNGTIYKLTGEDGREDASRLNFAIGMRWNR